MVLIGQSISSSIYLSTKPFIYENTWGVMPEDIPDTYIYTAAHRVGFLEALVADSMLYFGGGPRGERWLHQWGVLKGWMRMGFRYEPKSSYIPLGYVEHEKTCFHEKHPSFQRCRMTEKMPGRLVIYHNGYPPLTEARVMTPLSATVLDPDEHIKLLYLPRPWFRW